MKGHGPRLVILDNDQTTGDFTPLFYWITWVERSGLVPYISLKALVPTFIEVCEAGGVFRPGLRGFLRRLSAMRRGGKIDDVIMYTNQTDVPPYHYDKLGSICSVPRLLEAMYNAMSGNECLIGLRLVRPRVPISQIPKKSFRRVFEALQLPRDQWIVGDSLFYDDLPRGEVVYGPGVKGGVGDKERHIGGGRGGHVVLGPYFNSGGSRVLLELCLATLRVARRFKVPTPVEEKAILGIHYETMAYMKEIAGTAKQEFASWTAIAATLKIFDR
jgi:hypothetical protein